MNSHVMRSSVKHISNHLYLWRIETVNTAFSWRLPVWRIFLRYFTLEQWICFSCFLLSVHFVLFFIYHASQTIVCGWEPVHKLFVTEQQLDKINGTQSLSAEQRPLLIVTCGAQCISTVSPLLSLSQGKHYKHRLREKTPNVNRCR